MTYREHFRGVIEKGQAGATLGSPMYLLLGLLVLFCAVVGYGLFSWHYGGGALLIFSFAALFALQGAYLATMVVEAFK